MYDGKQGHLHNLSTMKMTKICIELLTFPIQVINNITTTYWVPVMSLASTYVKYVFKMKHDRHYPHKNSNPAESTKFLK